MADAHIEGHGELKAFMADASATGHRVDQWLASVFSGCLSRSRLKKLIEDGHVGVNGAQVLLPSYKLAAGDRIEVALPKPADAAPMPEDIPLKVLFEDSDVIVLDKPPGMVVHPGAGNPTGTLVNALLHHCGDTLSGIGGVKRPGIVHRLDKDTSGVMVVAKNDRAHAALSAQFADHGRSTAMERSYLALVWGAPERMAGTIDTFLGRSSRDRLKQAVVNETQPDARHAVTRFKTLERFGDPSGHDTIASLVKCTLETGRTHQIRVHMAHIGHPLVGDQEYGKGFATKANLLPEMLKIRVNAFHRQALHAASLAFEHPATGEVLRFDSNPPDEMQSLVSGFRDIA